MREGALGCTVKISGRLGGAEIARVEYERAGSIPLNHLDSRVDYGYGLARTTAGIIGVRVWINLGRYGKEG